MGRSDDDACEQIMAATYRALCEHGYADLTTRDIADEWGKTTAALHYHYDTKQALLLSFLEYLVDSFVDRVTAATEGVEDPADRLRALLDAVFEGPDADDQRAFRVALLEIKAQAPYVEPFRTQLERVDRFVHDEVEAAVAAGIEDGTFRADVDPDAVASFVVASIDGAHTRQATLDADADAVEGMLTDYVETRLLASGGGGDGGTGEGERRDPAAATREARPE